MIVLALLVVGGGSATSAPSPGAGTGFYADASWFFPTKDPKILRWYSVTVAGTSELAEENYADIAKGRCRIKSNGYSSYLGCVGLIIASARVEDVFQMDPAMQTAQLALEDRKGKVQTVSWQAKAEAPWVADMQEVCNVGFAGAAFLTRDATAVAEIGGVELNEPAPWEGFDMTGLSRWIGADACAAERSPTDSVEVTRMFSLPKQELS